MAEVERAVAGVDGIVHLGGFSVEGPWDTILQANIVGCYNLFEAARRHGVERVVFASSNHVVGFYPRQRRIGVDDAVRPDSRYGVSKAFGEALAALYAYKHGLRVTCIRIGNFGDAPVDQRRLSIWIAAAGPGAAHPHRARASRTSATRSSTAPPTMRAAGGTTVLPSGTATGRKAAARTTRRRARRAGEAAVRSGRRLVRGRAVLQRRVRPRHRTRAPVTARGSLGKGT